MSIKTYFRSLFSLLSGIDSEVELLDHMAFYCLILGGIAIQCTILHPYLQSTKVPILGHPC